MTTRTVPFRTLYDHLIGRMGLDPLTDIGQGIARNVVRILNEVIADTWSNTPFPELTSTEERPFREIWNLHKQYYRFGPGITVEFTDKLRDEVIWLNLENEYTYYGVRMDAPGIPPVGSNPALDPTHWEVLETVEPFVARDQPLLGEIETVFGVYGSDPSITPGNNPDGMVTGCACQGLDYQPSERGVRVLSSCGKTVWVWFQKPAPQFTIVPYIAESRDYHVGDRAYLPENGRVYRCIVDQPFGTLNASNWVEEVVPAFLFGYLVSATCAAYLRTGQPDQSTQARIGLATVAEAEAAQRYQGLVDQLSVQGYKPRMKWPARPGCCNHSNPWLGDIAHPLVFAWLFPSVDPPEMPLIPSASGVTWEYLPAVKFLRTIEGWPSLSGVDVSSKDLTSYVELIIVPVGQTQRQRMTFTLVAGAADPTDPGQVAPDGYASVSNNKHWERVSG